MDIAGLQINQNGHAYRNGAAYPAEMRVNVVLQWEEGKHLNPSITAADIGARLGPRPEFCQDVIDLWEAGESIFPAERLTNAKAKMGEAEIDLLVLLWRANPARRLADYKAEFRHILQADISTGTIAFYLNHVLGKTLKKTTIDRLEKYYPENMQKHLEFLSIILGIPIYKMKFFDEMSLTSRSGPEAPRSRSDRGTPATVVVPNMRYFRTSVNGITSIQDGRPCLFLGATRQTTNCMDFLDFFIGPHGCLAAGFVVCGDVVLIDNAHTHHQLLPILEPILAARGIGIVLLPPYRPEHNPIELVWSKLKYLIQHYGRATEHEAMVSLQRAAAEVTMADMRAYYSHCGYS
jgi:hypothetical protein